MDLYLNRNIPKKHLKTAIDDDQVAIIFGSGCILNMIKDSVQIQFDGTLCVVPKMFLQLLPYSFMLMAIHSLPSMC